MANQFGFLRLNPYFNGCSPMGAESYIPSVYVEHVLILILMDVAQWAMRGGYIHHYQIVLILILMDVAQWEAFFTY